MLIKLLTEQIKEEIEKDKTCLFKIDKDYCYFHIKIDCGFQDKYENYITKNPVRIGYHMRCRL